MSLALDSWSGFYRCQTELRQAQELRQVGLNRLRFGGINAFRAMKKSLVGNVAKKHFLWAMMPTETVPLLAPDAGWKVYPGFPRGLPWVPVFSLVFVRFLLLRWEPRVHHFKSAWNVNDVHAFTHRVWNGMCLSQVNAHVRVV